MPSRSSKSTGRKSPVTGTFASFLDRRGGEESVRRGQSMSFAEVFRARTSPTPALGLGLKESEAVYGPSSIGSFAFFGLEASSWKTWQRSFLEGLEPFSGTWPRAGTTRNGIAFPRQPSAPIIREIDSGSWPTPSSQEPGVKVDRLVTKDGQPAKRGERAYDKITGRLAQCGLTQQVQMWPTPTTRDWKDGTAESCKNVPPNGLLGRVVHWPMMPTPTSSRRTGLQSHGVNVVTGSLNPTWVEWLMGYPLGWTDLKDSETPSSPKSASTSDTN